MTAVFLFALLLHYAASDCPDSCVCINAENGTDVECRGINHWNNTTTFPVNTTKLGIHHTFLRTRRLERMLANLNELKNLTLEDTHLEHLSVNLFSGLTNLEELQLLSCLSITRLDPHSFGNLTQLRRFRITGNRGIAFDSIVTSIMEINASEFNTLIVDGQGTRSYAARPTLLYKYYRMFDNKLISTVVLSNNLIQRVKGGFSAHLTNVTCVILQGNLITQDWTAVFDIMLMQSLRYIDGSHQGKQSEFTNNPNINSICLEPLPLSTEVWDLDPKILKENEELTNKLCRVADSTIFGLSPNLRYIFISDMYPGVLKTPYVTSCFHHNNRVRYIDASHNPLDYTKPSIGLIRLQYFNVQYNSITGIRYHSFAHYPSLTTLLLGGNKLAAWFARGNATFPLHKLDKLVSLDLALNKIAKLIGHDLRFLVGLQNVNLSSNYLKSNCLDTEVDVRFKLLNLSSNKLTDLPKSFRASLDKKPKGSHFVDLSGNPFVCTCENLEFLEWFINNKKYFINFDSYSCRPNYNVVKINEDMVIKLKKACFKNILYLIVGIVCGVLALVTIVGVSYRHRNQINYYLIFRPYLKWKRYHIASQNYTPLFNETDFDVFVAHSYNDRLFVRDKVRYNLEQRGLSVCIGEDEFRGGEDIVDYIVSAVRSCRCTLLIVSKNLHRSKWCNYEITMSLAMNKRVIVLSLDDVPSRLMLPGMIYLNHQTRYIYSNDKNDEHLEQTFWDKMAIGLKDKINTTLM